MFSSHSNYNCWTGLNGSRLIYELLPTVAAQKMLSGIKDSDETGKKKKR
jgi:hypothetical protein